MPKRQSYTVSFKLQALQYLDNEAGGNVSECAREFSVDRKRIREWSENRDRLEQQYGKKNKNGNCGKNQQLDLNMSTKDDEVLEWFPDEIGAVLPRVDGNAPGPEEPESEDASPDDSDADADFEGLE
ncbi:hypothetical protein ACOMHN_017477 [Nucella lapillus]